MQKQVKCLKNNFRVDINESREKEKNINSMNSNYSIHQKTKDKWLLLIKFLQVLDFCVRENEKTLSTIFKINVITTLWKLFTK